MLLIVIPFYTEFNAVKPGLRALRATGLKFDVQPVQGPLVHTNRNAGINHYRSSKTYQDALEGYSHFLFIDSDISFSPAHVNIALGHDANVVVLPYLRHENDGMYQVGELEHDSPLIHCHYSKNERGIRHVTFSGAGFMLVKRDVFSAIPYPWFRCGVHSKNGESRSLGEDLMFCGLLREKSFSILCDFDHPVHHRLRKQEDFDVRF